MYVSISLQFLVFIHSLKNVSHNVLIYKTAGKDTEASELTSSKPREYQCKLGDTTRKVAQVQVATDGLTLAVKKDSAADKCIQILGGLTLDQIRWMYSSLNEVQLESGGDWDPESIPFSDGLANTHKWNELSDECADAEILISGADSVSF